MINHRKLLAIIPARGGSKRLPKKNILDLSEKPLIAWTIESALESKYIDRVIVSTDDNDIATISKKYGADVPFMRPNNLATDESTSIDVVLHSIDYFEKVGEKYDYIILLQPTSPFRTAEDIDKSLDYMVFKKAGCVVSVCKVDHPTKWCNSLPADSSLNNFLSENIIHKRSQDFQAEFRINGAIYINKVESILEERSMYSETDAYAYIMKRINSIDIDSQYDFDFAQCVAKKTKESLL